MNEKSSTECMIEFQRKYAKAGRDPLLRSLCIKIREEGVLEGRHLTRRSSRAAGTCACPEGDGCEFLRGDKCLAD